MKSWASRIGRVARYGRCKNLQTSGQGRQSGTRHRIEEILTSFDALPQRYRWDWALALRRVTLLSCPMYRGSIEDQTAETITKKQPCFGSDPNRGLYSTHSWTRMTCVNALHRAGRLSATSRTSSAVENHRRTAMRYVNI